MAQGFGDVTPVRRHMARQDFPQQVLCLRSIAGMPRCQEACQQPALGVDLDVQFGAETAPAAYLGSRLQAVLVVPSTS